MGKLDRDGREELRDKYYLSPRQYNRLLPPTLESSRLHMIGSQTYGGLSEKLLAIHRYSSLTWYY